jgi:hypothetical protein
MQPQKPLPAGQAKEVSGSAENPVGLYKHPDGFFVGVLDPAGGDAVVRQGFTLYKEGREAAMTPEKPVEAPKDSK